MTDPYEILGVSKNATEDEINTAYRNLVKKYHPDKYVGNPLADLAAEKIREINSAYDAVMDNLKSKSSGSFNSNMNHNTSYDGKGFDSNEIRRLINEGNFGKAQQLLSAATVRDAEWHFLMGMLLKNKGWFDMAYQHLNRACSLDPSNAEYRTARDGLDFSGHTYRQMGTGACEMDCCNLCQGLMCADCCCEMCGANLIPCIGCRQ